MIDLPRPRKRWFRRLLWCALAAVVLLNALAFSEAWSMTHYITSGARTKSLEKLTLGEKCRILLLGPTVTRPQNKLNPADYRLDTRTVYLESSGGHRVEAWRTIVPGAPAVLMFPGYACSKDTLLRAAQEFSKKGFEVWMVDFRGCGGSSGNTTSIGWHEADDVAAVFAAAHTEYPGRKLLLYGQSLGASAVLRAAGSKGVLPDAIIVEAPFDSLLQTIGNRLSTLGLPRFPFSHLLVFWGGVQQGFNGFDHSPAQFARQIRVPTLVMMGENDTRVGLQAGKLIASNLADYGAFHIFKGRRHAFLVQDATEEWNETVTAFLRDKAGL